MVPSCVPERDGFGPYRRSPVWWVPTVMDRLDAAGLSWRIYAPGNTGAGHGYGWAICPTFADCLDTPQSSNMMPSTQVIADAKSGSLPNLSLVMPTAWRSQHNFYSMRVGDDWIGQVVSAIEHGPQWQSTTIFTTYDDCGCFYDHVRPPRGLGIRVPMDIVSPYARRNYRDHTTASLSSILAYTDHVFALAPLGADATAYPYTRSFDYNQRPLAPISLTQHRISRRERAWITRHPAPPETT